MNENQEDLADLQALLDASAVQAGPFLREFFQILERSLTAAQLAKRLQGLNTVALGTATRGAPGSPYQRTLLSRRVLYTFCRGRSADLDAAVQSGTQPDVF